MKHHILTFLTPGTSRLALQLMALALSNTERVPHGRLYFSITTLAQKIGSISTTSFLLASSPVRRSLSTWILFYGL
jgi:hypothetical protein